MPKYDFLSSQVCCFFVVFVFFNNGRSGSESSTRFGINFVRCCTLPRNERSCFRFFRFSSFIMASVLVTSGVIAEGVMVNPSHSILFFANSHFCRLIASPSSSSFYSILSNSCSCSFIVPFVISSISSRNANFDGMPSNVLSMVF